MRTLDMPFRTWTKKEITNFCLRNNYGEPKFSGKKRIMFIPTPKSNWGANILKEIAERRLKYKVQFT